ncbi:MAG: LPS export ABC transporter periplasmic protein LptC [Gemmatimonadota bacterium]
MDKKIRRRLIPVLTVLSLVVVGACEEDAPTPVADPDLRSLQADGIFYGMETYLRQDGIRSGMVEADSAYQFTDSAKTYLWQMEMTLFYEDGRDRAWIRADSAVLETRTEQLVARGNVVAEVADEGVRIESPELQYDPTASQIWTDSSVVLTQDGAVQRGTCFRSDLQFRNWEICSPVGDIPTREPGGGP